MKRYLAKKDGYLGTLKKGGIGFIPAGTEFEYDGKPGRWMEEIPAAGPAAPEGSGAPGKPGKEAKPGKPGKEGDPAKGERPKSTGDQEVI